MQSKKRILMVLMALTMVVSCLAMPDLAFAGGKKKLKVTSPKTVRVGKSIKIKTNVKAKFKSSNKKIATVNNKGVVKGKKAGKVKITVTSKKNKKQKKVVKITVKKKKKQESVKKPALIATPTPTSKAVATKTPSATQSPQATKAPKAIGITAEYKGAMPKGTSVHTWEMILTVEFDDKTVKKIDGKDIPIEDATCTYKNTEGEYEIYDVSYLNLSTEMKVQVVEVEAAEYPVVLMLSEYKGDAIKKGETPDISDMLAEVMYSNSDFKDVDVSDLHLILKMEDKEDERYMFYVIYEYYFEYEGKEMYTSCLSKLYVPLE